MPNSAGSKKAAALSRGTHVERKEFRRRIRLTYRKELSFSLTYIVYQIFLLVQIFIGFFLPAMDGGGILHCWLNFCRQFLQKKEAVYTLHSQRDAPRKKSLLSQIQYNTKCVKLQVASCRQHKKQAATNAACSFRFASLQFSRQTHAQFCPQLRACPHQSQMPRYPA